MFRIALAVSLALTAVAVNAQVTQIVEDFSSTDEIDTLLTTGRIDVIAGEARLAPAAGAFRPPLAPTSAPKSTVLVSQGFDRYAIGDINGDTFPDIFMIDRGNDYFAAGSPGGDFTGALTVITDGFDDQIVTRLVDMDADGDIDIFVGNSDTCCTDESSFFLVNDGSPSFPQSSPERYSVGVPEEGLTVAAFADLNGDKLIDMITRSSDSGVTYYLNNGTSQPFPETQRRSFPGAATSVTAILPADFNNDGAVDLFLGAASFSGFSSLYLNTGNPASPFGTAPVPAYTANFEADILAVADMDADGLLDVVGNDRFDDSILVLRNIGTSQVFDATPDITGVGTFRFAGVIDADQNGLPDVVADNFDPVRVYLNQGGGQFSSSDFIELVPNLNFKQFPDINDDGVVDLVGQSFSGSQLLVYKGEDGRSPFDSTSPVQSFGAAGAFTTSIAVADIDNDGDVDVAEGSNGINRIYLNSGGSLSSAFSITADADDTRAVAAGDLNDDGFADIVVANNGLNKWYPNDLGDGPFRRADSGIVIGSTAALSYDVRIADLNDDGRPDLVFANDGINEVYLNDGSAEPFGSQSTAFAVGVQDDVSLSVAVLDVTGDSLPDLVFGNQAADTWYANDGTQAPFSPVSVVRPLGDDVSRTAEVAVIDLDFNGVDDVLLAKPAGSCRWFSGLGNDMGFAGTGSGAVFSSNCTEATDIAVNQVSGVEWEIVAGGQTPNYFRVLQSTGAEAAVGLSISDDVSPMRDLAFARLEAEQGDILTANFFAQNRISKRIESAFSGEPGAGRFSLLGNLVRSNQRFVGGGPVESLAIDVQSTLPPNSALTLKVSNNAIDFFDAQPGTVVRFPVPGNSVTWLAKFSSLSPALSPSLARVTISVNAPDGDEDGIVDTADNCSLVANPDQVDLDGDGFGNACDADLNNDGIVNAFDLGIFRAVFFSTVPSAADFNNDGVVNSIDLAILRDAFFSPPGPGATTAP